MATSPGGGTDTTGSRVRMSSTSSFSGDETWPEVLATLTDKAKREGLLDTVKRAKGFLDKVRRVQEGAGIGRRLTAWISHCSESRYTKSGGTASKLRDEGNAKFASGDNRGALKLYSESVVCSPKWGPELSLAFGNRSASLYHLGRYEACLQDVALALKYRFPKDSVHKLLQRRGLCLMKLGRHAEALEALQEALKTLEQSAASSKMPPRKRSALGRDLRAQVAEINNYIKDSDGKSVDTTAGRDEVALSHGGSNLSLPGASEALTLAKDEARGRHVTANRDLDVGDVLFTEYPFCSVLLPEHYATHCHHCQAKLEMPVPCLECTQPRYCSERCREVSWDGYHRFECGGGLDLLNSVGVAHLAVRALFECGLGRLREIRPFVDRRDLSLSKSADNIAGEYGRVIGLVQHVDATDPEDLFQYSVTAVLLTTFLEQRTKFFQDDKPKGAPFAAGIATKPAAATQDEEFSVFVSAVLLKHILQLVCNASAIFEVAPSPSVNTSSLLEESPSSMVYSERQQRVATALYPSASMMNHSCDPTVISSFRGRLLIARAVRHVAAGEEVFNCYGPHLRRHSKRERQEILSAQYNFRCACRGCRDATFDDFVDRFSALRCRHCSGAIKNPDDDEDDERDLHELPCMDCGKRQEYKEQVEASFTANELFLKGLEYLSAQDVNPATQAFEQCLALRQSSLHERHDDLSAASDKLAQCYAMSGRFEDSAACARSSVAHVKDRFGAGSVESAHELMKVSDVLMALIEAESACQLGSGREAGAEKMSKLDKLASEAREKLEEARLVFLAHYGEQHETYKEAEGKLKQLEG